MDLATTVGKGAIQVGEHEIQRLTLDELGELTELIRKQRREQLVKTLDECGLEGFDRFTELQKFDMTPIGLIDGARWSREPQGLQQTVGKALSKSGIDLEISDLGLDADDLMYLSYGLWGFRITRVFNTQNPDEEGEKEEQDPLKSTNRTSPTGA